MTYQISNIAKKVSLWIFLALLAYMPLHIFISTWLGTSFGVLDFAKMVKDGLLLVGFLLIFATSINKRWFKESLKDKLVLAVLAFAALNLLLALLRPTDQDAELLGLVYNTRFFLMFLYAWLLAYHFKPDYLQAKAVKIVLASGLVVVLIGVAQYLFIPNNFLAHFGYARENGVLPAFFIDDKPDLERVMSTLRDPNSLGSYLLIILALLIARLRNMKYQLSNIAYGVLALMCLWFTFSRSAWLGFVLALGVIGAVYLYGKKQLVNKYKKPAVLVMASVLVIFAGLLGALKDSYFVQNVVFHADQSTVLEDPNELRVRFWQESVADIANDPIGSGPGTAGLASIRNEKQGTELNENYYLQVGSELGIVGLALFIAILSVVAWRLYLLRQNKLALALLASFVGLALTNFLVHIWSNEAVAYTWWALAGLVLVRNFPPKRTKQA